MDSIDEQPKIHHHPDVKRDVEESFTAGLRDGAVALIGLGALSVFASSRWPFYSGFSPAARGFFVLAGATTIAAFSMESEVYRRHYAIQRAQTPLRPATWKDWVILHKHQIIYGTMAASGLVGGVLVMRNRRLDPIVRGYNWRLFMQGATLSVFIATMAVIASHPYIELRREKHQDAALKRNGVAGTPGKVTEGKEVKDK